MSDVAKFKAAVEKFLTDHNVSPSSFGTKVAGDPQFVFDLREGREPRSDTRSRIQKAMQDFVSSNRRQNETFKIGVAGLGTVGASLARMLLADRDDLVRRNGRAISLTHVAARSRNRDRGVDLSGAEWADDPVGMARDGDIDLFVELIGGEDGPAYAAVRAALERGIPVVTANKALLAKHGLELAKLAEKTGTTLGFEAAVAGGIPVIKALREGLGSATVRRVYGIMNGTCNYILTRMGSEEISFEDCLKDAQALGYAEADPTFDVEGFDTAHKLALLTTLCFGTEVASDEIDVEGITKINQVDIKVASDLGYKIKLLGVAEATDEGIEQRVHPTLVAKSTSIAGIDGVLNAVAMETNHVSELLLAGPGAGGDATAASVLSDILDIVRENYVPPLGLPTSELAPYVKAPMRAHAGGYFIRFNARDVPGALASITARMAESDISLESVIQRPDLRVGTGKGEADASQPVVLITHDTTEECVRAAIESIAKDDYIVGETQLIRIQKF